VLFTLLFSCTADWIDPNDFSLTYKYSDTVDVPKEPPNSENSNQSISETNENTQTEAPSSNEPSQDPSTENTSEQEESEQEESESSQPSNEPTTEQVSTDEQDPVENLLLDGTWSILDPVIVAENCNVNAWSSIVDIYDLVPSEFEVANVSNIGFSMNLLGVSILCSIENGIFFCDTYETVIPVPSFDASGEVLFLYEGIVQSSSSLTMNLEIDIYNCTGNDCPILAFLVPYPCQITMESDADFTQ
jgi:hypothetical protein